MAIVGATESMKTRRRRATFADGDRVDVSIPFATAPAIESAYVARASAIPSPLKTKICTLRIATVSQAHDAMSTTRNLPLYDAIDAWRRIAFKATMTTTSPHVAMTTAIAGDAIAVESLFTHDTPKT
jgi:hypothetical protein